MLVVGTLFGLILLASQWMRRMPPPDAPPNGNITIEPALHVAPPLAFVVLIEPKDPHFKGPALVECRSFVDVSPDWRAGLCRLSLGDALTRPAMDARTALPPQQEPSG